MAKEIAGVTRGRPAGRGHRPARTPQVGPRYNHKGSQEREAGGDVATEEGTRLGKQEATLLAWETEAGTTSQGCSARAGQAGKWILPSGLRAWDPAGPLISPQ